MEDKESSVQYDEEEEFLDVFDHFPFYDCIETSPEEIESDGSRSISAETPTLFPRGENPNGDGLRLRWSKSRVGSFDTDSKELSGLDSTVSLENEVNYRDKRERPSRKIREFKKSFENSTNPRGVVGGGKDERNGECSTLTGANNDTREDSVEVESNLNESHSTNSSLLLDLAGIVMKLFSYQICLLVKLFMFPVWSVYYLCMIVLNPFGLVSLCSGCLNHKLRSCCLLLFQTVSHSLYEWLKEHQAIWKLGLKCGWGLLWSAYVCSVLIGLLVSAFVMGGILIRMLVEEPIRINRSLNFNYAEKSPVAFVPITVNEILGHDVYLGEKTEISKAIGSRVIPSNHKLEVTVSLTLPESDYNQNLGIFQVRVDFLDTDGKTLASSRRPCMLQFRSYPIRLLLTMFKVAPILTGYASETQNLKINFKGFTEGDKPTNSLRVVIEQRAEFLPGAGIPEIYTANLILGSGLPLLKHALWFWKKTLFVWISMVIFIIELFCALVCCAPIVIPKIRMRQAANRDTYPNNHPGSS